MVVTVEALPETPPAVTVSAPVPAGVLQETPLEPPPAVIVRQAHRITGWLAQAGTRLAETTAALRKAMSGIRWTRKISLNGVLFGLVLAVYLLTRLVGLTDFPIYFFTDEAVQTVLAADFVRDDFHNYDHDFLPTYFVNGSQYNLGTSVYLQVIPYMLFGKSIWVTRGIAVLATLLGAVAASLVLRDVFKVRCWWLGTLVLSSLPAWFLHSRTAFETTLMVSLYGGFLYFYLLYRTRSPRYLYTALVLGALAFYTYSPGQVVVVLTGLLLLISDAGYHWKNRKTALVGLGILALLALPYLRFALTRGQENIRHLQILGSYWAEPISLTEKLTRYGSEYLRGLNPLYWFLPNNDDLSRHLMKGYGHLPRLLLPFFILGVLVALRNFRVSSYRAVLLAGLAAPAGAAVVHIGITRLLVFVLPAALLIALGLAALLDWLVKRRVPVSLLATLVFAGLAVFNVAMLRDALVNGPTWFADYGLGGMQYGARQLFSAVQEYLRTSPDAKIIVSPSWANGTDEIARFFLPDDSPAQLGSIDGYFTEVKPLDENTLFVMIPEEYQRMQESGKFTDIRVEKILPYPDGQPGFYFVRLNYVDNIEQLLEAERNARRELLLERVEVAGEPALVRYSMLDMGTISNVFDKDSETLLRSLEANPLQVEIAFDQPVPVSGVVLRVGGTPTRITATLTVAGNDAPLTFTTEVPGDPLSRDVPLDFDGPWQVQVLSLEVLSVNDGEPAHVHLWEIWIK